MTLNNYIEITKLDTNSITYENDLIQIIYNLSNDEIDELDVDVFRDYIKKIDRSSIIRKIPSNSIIQGKELKFDLNKITFGEYIDMETYLKDEKFNKFLQVLFKTPDIDFGEQSVTIFFYGYDEFTSFQNNLFSNYSSLFGTNDEEEIIDDKEILISPKKRFEDNQNKIKQENERKWGWISIAFSLAKRDITKLDDVLNLNFIMVLNILLMVKDLQIDLNPQPYYPTT